MDKEEPAPKHIAVEDLPEDLPTEVVEDLEEVDQSDLTGGGPPSTWVDHEDYQILPATGAYGGIQPPGQFQATFMYDHVADPGQESAIKTDTPVTTSTEGGGFRIRQRQVTLSMGPSQAYSVATWMLEKVTSGSQEEIEEVLQENFGIRFGAGGPAPLAIHEGELSDEQAEKIDKMLESDDSRKEIQDRLKEVFFEIVEEYNDE